MAKQDKLDKVDKAQATRKNPTTSTRQKQAEAQLRAKAAARAQAQREGAASSQGQQDAATRSQVRDQARTQARVDAARRHSQGPPKSSGSTADTVADAVDELRKKRSAGGGKTPDGKGRFPRLRALGTGTKNATLATSRGLTNFAKGTYNASKIGLRYATPAAAVIDPVLTGLRGVQEQSYIEDFRNQTFNGFGLAGPTQDQINRLAATRGGHNQETGLSENVSVADALLPGVFEPGQFGTTEAGPERAREAVETLKNVVTSGFTRGQGSYFNVEQERSAKEAKELLTRLRAVTPNARAAGVAYEDIINMREMLSNPEVVNALNTGDPEYRNAVIGDITENLQSHGVAGQALLQVLKETNAAPDFIQAVQSRVLPLDAGPLVQDQAGNLVVPEDNIESGFISESSFRGQGGREIRFGSGLEGSTLFTDLPLRNTQHYADIDQETGNLTNFNPDRPRFTEGPFGEGDRAARDRILSRFNGGATNYRGTPIPQVESGATRADRFEAGLESLRNAPGVTLLENQRENEEFVANLRSPDLAATIARDRAATLPGTAGGSLSNLPAAQRHAELQRRIEEGQRQFNEYTTSPLLNRQARQNADPDGSLRRRAAAGDTVAARSLRLGMAEEREKLIELAEKRFTPQNLRTYEGYEPERFALDVAEANRAEADRRIEEFDASLEDTVSPEMRRKIRTNLRRTGLMEAIRKGDIKSPPVEEIIAMDVLTSLADGLQKAGGGGGYIKGLGDAYRQGGLQNARALLHQQFKKISEEQGSNFRFTEPNIIDAVFGGAGSAWFSRTLNTASGELFGSKGPETVIFKGPDGQVTLGDLGIIGNPEMQEFLQEMLKDVTQ